MQSSYDIKTLATPRDVDIPVVLPVKVSLETKTVFLEPDARKYEVVRLDM